MQNEKNASWAWVKHPASPCAITPSEVKALYGTPALRLPKGLAAATIAACTVVEVVVILGQSARVSLQILFLHEYYPDEVGLRKRTSGLPKARKILSNLGVILLIQTARD